MALRSCSSRRAFSLIASFEFTPAENLHYLTTLPKHETYGLPWSFTGYAEKSPLMRYIADRQLMQTRIPIRPILGEFWKMFQAVLNAFVQGDLTPVDSYLESNLKLKLEMLLSQLKSEGKTLKLEKNLLFEKESPKPTINVHDAVIYRGLSHKRTENRPMDEYHVLTEKDLGLVCFTHSDLSNQYAYVDQKNIEKLLQRNRLCLLQYLVFLKTSFQLNLVGGNGEVLSKYSPLYSFGQEWLFENQLVPGPPMKNEDKAENYMEWISKHRMGTWRIADMSNIMEGNPLAIKLPEETSQTAGKK